MRIRADVHIGFALHDVQGLFGRPYLGRTSHRPPGGGAAKTLREERVKLYAARRRRTSGRQTGECLKQKYSYCLLLKRVWWVDIMWFWNSFRWFASKVILQVAQTFLDGIFGSMSNVWTPGKINTTVLLFSSTISLGWWSSECILVSSIPWIARPQR